MNMNNLMKQAQQMQKRMLDIQEELATRTVEATVGGGMVTAVVNGQQEQKLLIQMISKCSKISSLLQSMRRGIKRKN